MRFLSLVLALACGAVTGCRSATPPSGYGVDVTIDARSLSRRSQVTRVSITTSGAEIYAHTFEAASQIRGGGLLRTRYVPSVKAGSLVFIVDALDDSGTILGVATTMPVVLQAGKAVQVDIVLADGVGGPPDGGMPVDMLPSTCTNGTKDTNEVDVDCGGPCSQCEPGKICVKSDDCATGACVMARCELATGPPGWVAVASLPAARANAGAGTLDTGLHVAGGQSASAFEQSTLRYDLASSAWVSAGYLQQPHSAFPVVAAAGRLFALGGINTIDFMMPTSTSAIEASDATVAAWTQRARTLSAPRAFHAGALGADGLVYIAGGNPYPAPGVLSTFESIDPATDAPDVATAQPALPLARTQLAAAPDALGRIAVIGGELADSSVTGQVDRYDTATKMWSSGPALAVPRAGLGAALGPDGRIYAVGGYNAVGGGLADVEALVTSATHWTSIVSISPARSGIAVARGWDGRMYAVGGRASGSPVNTVEAYGPKIQPGPTMGSAGTAIALTCTNFAANANVTVKFSGDVSSVVAVSGKSNAQGNVNPSLVWHVPQVASGTYFLTAVDDRSRYPVRTAFVVP